MTKQGLKALRVSIRHWAKNVRTAEQGNTVAIGPDNCALCRVYYYRITGNDCYIRHSNGKRTYCPVCNENPVREYCERTPYNEVRYAINVQDRDRLIIACKDELNFLKSLLPKK